MTILDLLIKAAAAAGGLVTFLEKVKTSFPDLADEADKYIAVLATAVSPDNLAAVGIEVVKELKDIGSGKIVPKDHPSDLA